MEQNRLKFNKGIINAIVLIALIGIPISLNLGLKINSFLIIALTIGVSLTYIETSNYNKDFKLSKIDVLYLTLFFLIQVVSLSYSSNIESGLKQIETKFALILIPLVLILLFKKRKISTNLIFLIIITFGISLIVIFYLYVIPSWIINSNIDVKSLNKLIPNKFGHVYFSMFSVFSYISFYHIYKKTENKKFQFLMFCCITLLFLIPIVLTARNATFILLLATVFIVINDKKNRFKFVYLIVTSILITILFAITFPSKVKRFSNIFNRSEFYNPIYHRKKNLVCAFEIFQDYPIKGVGTGSVQSLLNKCYKEKNYWGLKHNFNSHNEYLEEMARHGIIGVFNISFLFFYPVLISIKKRYYMYLSFSIIIIIASLTENILSRQIGVVFFAFFNTLFYLKCINKTNE